MFDDKYNMDEGVSFKAQQDMQQRVEKLYSQIKLNLKEKTYKKFCDFGQRRPF